MSLRSMATALLAVLSVLAGPVPAQAAEGDQYSIRVLQDTAYALGLDGQAVVFQNREVNPDDYQLWIETGSKYGPSHRYFTLKNKKRPYLCLWSPSSVWGMGWSASALPCQNSSFDRGFWWTWIPGVNGGARQLLSLISNYVLCPKDPQHLDGTLAITWKPHTVSCDVVKGR